MLAHFIFNPAQAFLLSIDAANLIVGSYVLFKNPRHIINRAFYIFVTGSVAWSLGVSLLYITHNFIFDKLALGGGFVLYFGLTLFAYVFPSRKHVSPKFFLLYVPLVAASILLPFNLFIQGITVDQDGFIQPSNGPLFPFFVAITLGYVGTAICFFIRRFLSSTGLARMQMQYLITGIILFILSLAVFDAILPAFDIYEFNLLGPAASLIFVCLSAYAIARHRLMDIRIVIQRGSIYSLLIFLIIASYLGVVLITRSYLRHQEIVDALLDSLVTVFGIITIPRIERYFRKVTNTFFFKDQYEYATALETLSTILNTNIEISLMVSKLIQALDEILHPRTIGFFNSDTVSIEIPEHGTCVPVHAQGRIIGVFVLGPKRSGDPYTSEDYVLLRTFAIQASVAFGKAELYEELQEYSKSLEEMVRVRTEKLAQAQAGQRQLFDDISHAFQTPLTVLKGAMGFHKIDDGYRETRNTEAMERSIEELSGLIREIMQLARMDALPPEKAQQSCDLSSVVKEVTEYVEIVCRERNIKIIAHIDAGIVILGNRRELEEVLTNLLSNAVHYTAECAVREIYVELTKQDTVAKLLVKDTGIGIPAERLPVIFERFYRTPEHDTALKTGYGLGLAIVKRIVERHKGTISVSSDRGVGTCFTISFPILQSDDELELATQA
jgi:signal transduction histidine kinase